MQITAELNDRDIDRKGIISTLERLGLEDVINLPINNFSKGMLQRVGIAQSIFLNKRILIFDEPLSGLDQQGLSLIFEIFKELQSPDRVILYTIHHESDFIPYATKVGVMSKGVIAIEGGA